VTGDRIRVLLVDDHPFYREGVRAMLDDPAYGVDVCGEAATGEEALERAVADAPDVVVMDLAMPGMGGLEATRRLVSAHPGLPVLVLTMHDDESVFAALRAGARGYLLKDATVDELARAVHAVRRGDAILDRGVAARVIASAAASPARREAELAFPELTERERDVLALMAGDLPTRQIARRLGIAEKTAYNYIATIVAKLHARDRADAAERARRAGLGGG